MIAAFGLEWRPSPYLLPTFLAGAITAVLAAYAWQHREKRAARPFVALMIGLVIWSVGYGLELGFASLEPMLWFDRVGFVGSVIVPTAWLVLCLEYAGYERLLSRRTVAALAVEPVLTLAFVWTSGHHGLVWAQTGLDASGPVTVPALSFGPVYWLNFAYSYLLVAGGLVLLGSVAVRANRIHRRQSFVLVVGSVVPLGANLAFHLVPRWNPVTNLDLTTTAFAVTGLAFALALFRYRMLDLVPVARERLVERMDDGVVVLASDGTIVDRNPAARRALSDAPVGTTVAKTAIGDTDGVVEGYVTLEVDGEERSYDVSATPISDFRGEAAGQFVVMRDITELQILRAHEQRLSVLNRLLRHNIRNELNVITGRSELLSDSIDGPEREHLDAIDRATERVLDISEQARHVDMTVADETASDPVDLAAVTTETVDALGDAHPDADIECERLEAARILGVRRRHVRRLVEELLENAIVHNDGPTPRVEVRVEQSDSRVRLVVTDDGPGIPVLERGIVDRERETALEHGTGLGLWLAKWIVDAAGGRISFSGNDQGGTTVVVDLPPAPADQ